VPWQAYNVIFPAMPVLTPTPSTLARYGLTEQEWRAILDRQGGVCYVCEQEPKKGRLCIDHEHAKGWKKMPPDQRKRFVRGLLCWFCNRQYLCRGITVERSQRVTLYLQEYERRFNDCQANVGNSEVHSHQQVQPLD
jgi:hypothetical protein